ncbi:hypothetical protein [Candidatus Sulfurimonas baltica]|nr:hypothetical protein [Candidatus Sulfurimonas baltica]
MILFIHTDAITAKNIAETLKDSIEKNEHHIAGKITGVVTLFHT